MKVEVKDENSGATIVLPIDQRSGAAEGDQENLLAVVDVGEDGQPTMTQAVTLGKC